MLKGTDFSKTSIYSRGTYVSTKNIQKIKAMVKNISFGVRETWFQIPSPSLTGYMTLDRLSKVIIKLCNLSMLLLISLSIKKEWQTLVLFKVEITNLHRFIIDHKYDKVYKRLSPSQVMVSNQHTSTVTITWIRSGKVEGKWQRRI